MKLNKKSLLREIGFRLGKVREQLGFTKPEMAERFGMSPNGYRKNENGETLPNIETLHRLSTEYGIDMDWFLFNRGQSNYQESLPTRELEKTTQELGQKLTETTNQLQTLEKETAPIRHAGQDIMQMVERMGTNPKLYHELLLYFHKIIEENPTITK
jgi:transcriptional regulator with XRE-family HTH domain